MLVHQRVSQLSYLASMNFTGVDTLKKNGFFSWILICATLLNRFWGRTHPLSCQTKAYGFSHGAPTKRWRKARLLALEEPETLKEPDEWCNHPIFNRI